jgi:hypothetical protein
VQFPDANPPASEQYASEHRQWVEASTEKWKDASWEELSINASLLERLLVNEVFDVGSVLFDVEASFGTMGVNFTAGLWFRRIFFSRGLKAVEAPCQFLPSPNHVHQAADGVVSAAMDELLGSASFAFGGAFTAWLSVPVALVPVPVGVNLLGLAEVLNVQTSASGATKMHVRGALVDINKHTTYREAEALFIRPANNPLNASRYELYHNMGLPELRRRGQLVLDGAEKAAISLARAKREKELSVIRAPVQQIRESSSSSVYVRWPPAALSSKMEAWLTGDMAISYYSERCTALEYAPALDYFEGKMLSQWYDGRSLPSSSMVESAHHQQNSSTQLSTYVCATVQFLNTCEGPPGSAHGGAVYALVEAGVQRALALFMEEQKGQGLDQVQVSSLKVAYRQRVPISTTLVLVCRLCPATHSLHVALQSFVPDGGHVIVFDDAEGTFGQIAPSRAGALQGRL